MTNLAEGETKLTGSAGGCMVAVMTGVFSRSQRWHE